MRVYSPKVPEKKDLIRITYYGMQPVFLAALPNSINVYDYLFLFFFFSAWCWGKHHPFVKPLNFSCKGSAETLVILVSKSGRREDEGII